MIAGMGWQFAGFFAKAEVSVLDAALRKWPDAQGRMIVDPFQGIGVAVPSEALTYGDTDEEYEQAQELAWALKRELVEWSRGYPTKRFVFIRADCFGGTCDYEGYICGDGIIQYQTKEANGSQNDMLRTLVQALGVELPETSYFEPLTRGYFDSKD